MKAKELMIGDWYYDVSLCYDKDDPNDEYRKVTRVGSIEHFMYDEDSNDIYRVNRNYSHPKDWNISQEKNMKPIPLTEEILKANGFEDKTENARYGTVTYCFFPDNMSITFEVDSGLPILTIEDTADRSNQHNIICLKDKIYNVHELQHALRLVGLNELADNFKVE